MLIIQKSKRIRYTGHNVIDTPHPDETPLCKYAKSVTNKKPTYSILIMCSLRIKFVFFTYSVQLACLLPCKKTFRIIILSLYDGVSNSSWHHPELKEPHTSFWYLIHKVSPKSHYAKLQTPPTFYWQSTDQNDTIGRKSEILRFDKNWQFLSTMINLHWMADYV